MNKSIKKPFKSDVSSNACFCNTGNRFEAVYRKVPFNTLHLSFFFAVGHLVHICCELQTYHTIFKFRKVILKFGNQSFCF